MTFMDMYCIREHCNVLDRNAVYHISCVTVQSNVVRCNAGVCVCAVIEYIAMNLVSCKPIHFDVLCCVVL